MPRRKPVAPFGNRILKSETVLAGTLLANPANWRIHPTEQQTALAEILSRIGFVQDVIVNLRTDPSWGRERHVETMVDGHLRVSLALSRGEDTPVPVSYVDLTREEEAAILATFDPIGSMAKSDADKLREVIADAPEDLSALIESIHAEQSASRRLVSFEATDRFRVIVDCADAHEQQALAERLSSEGYSCKAE